MNLNKFLQQFLAPQLFAIGPERGYSVPYLKLGSGFCPVVFGFPDFLDPKFSQGVAAITAAREALAPYTVKTLDGPCLVAATISLWTRFKVKVTNALGAGQLKAQKAQLDHYLSAQAASARALAAEAPTDMTSGYILTRPLPRE